jgi:hypothetical protein
MQAMQQRSLQFGCGGALLPALRGLESICLKVVIEASRDNWLGFSGSIGATN